MFLGFGFSAMAAASNQAERENNARKYAQKRAKKYLSQGYEAWNKWRKDSSYEPILGYKELQGKDLSKFNFYNVDLSGADLNGADLSGADLSGAILNFANLRNLKMSPETKLDKKWEIVVEVLNNLDFDRNLKGADFKDVNLEGVDFKGANLSLVKFNNANLREADLREADLTRATLNAAHCRKADFSKADLSYATLKGAWLYDVNLSGTELRMANLRNAKLRGADLNNADFSNADLRHTDLAYIDVRGTNFRGCEFTGANVFDWKGDSQTELGSIMCRYYRFKDKRRPRLPFVNLKDGEFRDFVTKEFMLIDKKSNTKPNESRTFINAPNSNISAINSGSGNINGISQTIGTNLNEIVQLIETLKKQSQGFPENLKDDIEITLEDLELDLANEQKRKPNRLRKRLRTLWLAACAIAVGVAGVTDFSNNLLELSEKLNVPIPVELIQQNPHILSSG